MTHGVPWTPVYDYGCGGRDCPECGPMIELEIEAKHRKRVEGTWPKRDELGAWQAEALGQLIAPEERAAAKAKHREYTERTRFRRTLSAKAEARAFEIIRATRVRRMYRANGQGRATWESEVWLELLNPTKAVARREQRAGIDIRVEKAINRAQFKLRMQYVENAKHVLCLHEPEESATSV